MKIGKYERDWWIESWWRFNYVERDVNGVFGEVEKDKSDDDVEW